MHTLHLGLCSSLKRVWNTLMLDESPETVRCCEEGAGLDDPAGQAEDDKDVRQQRHCCRSPEKMPWMRISSGAGYLQSACKSKADHLLKSRIRVRNLVNTSSRSYETPSRVLRFQVSVFRKKAFKCSDWTEFLP